jgi:hypothetical protein
MKSAVTTYKEKGSRYGEKKMFFFFTERLNNGGGGI